MRKGYLCSLMVAMVIASIMMAGCTTSNQASSSETTTTSTTSTSSTTSATSSAAASVSPTVTPSPSASPTATATPSISGTIATSIQFASDPGSVKQGTQVSLGIEVIAPSPPAPQPLVCNHGAVTVLIDGKQMGIVALGPSDCFRTAFFNLDTSSLAPRTDPYSITLRYAGDSMYRPSESSSKITITA